MDAAEKIKAAVRQRYGAIAEQTAEGCCATPVSFVGEDYAQLDGYIADADLGLGCGIPTATARMQPGNTVLDLGSGAGNDAFIASSLVGESGRVIGVDMTAPMIERARNNAEKRAIHNVEFRLGDLEALPVADNSIDVVISNCVINLVPNKAKVYAEIFRVLKPGGHFSISDIIVEGDLNERFKQMAEAYAGCVAGAMQKAPYLQIIEASGFANIALPKQRLIDVPDETLQTVLSAAEVQAYRASSGRIISVTVYGEKPA
ncbi:MAG: arsenite methyltransferase [Acidobacteria bacterium]|nr:arsenite methyltransferase [Acidobacteriota bacterium]